jgi:iron complex outermembrane recepter protein
VPVPVTALKADALVEQNQLRLEDYYTSIPGLSLTPSDLRGGPILTIRGVTTGSQLNPTVGITVDDVPYGSSTSLGGGFTAPDIDPSELAQVEVLRGPQGTLYGASSIGGLLKYVTVDPSTDAVSGRIQASTSSVRNGAELGYGFRGAINVPISDTFAIRASAFTRRDPGYIDDPSLSAEGVNEVTTQGGRLSALWRPSQEFSWKVSALYQDSRANGSPYVDVQPGLGDLQQSDVRGTGAFDRKIQAYSTMLDAKLGSLDLISVTGYSVNTISDSLDLTPALGFYTQNGLPGAGINGYGVAGTPELEHNETNKFSQEVRLSASVGESFAWLLGGFYTHERSQFMQNIQAADTFTGATVASLLDISFPTTFTEYAAFTNLTFRITDRFDVQVGGRESQNRQSYSEIDVGPFALLLDGAPSPFVIPELNTKASSFTYLVTPRFKVSPDLMLYARFASGYRAGGLNNGAAPSADVPPSYRPDTTLNYEVGVKGDVLEHMVSFDSSIYYIDWKDIQILELQPLSGSGYIANGSRAKSQGIELSAETKPLTGLTLSAWVTWNEAVLTQAFPPQSLDFGASGDRLPYSSRFSANFSAQQECPITDRLQGLIGGSVSYVGEREGVFVGTGQPRQSFPAYARTDLRAGLKYDSWKLNLFVNNVTDRRGVLTGGLGTLNPAAFIEIQPRIAGLSIEKTF